MSLTSTVLSVLVLSQLSLASLPGAGSKIALRQNSENPNGLFKKSDGTWDARALKKNASQYKENHSKGLANFEKFYGRQSKLVTPVSSSSKKRETDKKKRYISDYEMSINSDGSYTGIVGIGTPVQYFPMAFDTAYADSWVTSVECSGCSSDGSYNPAVSSTAVNTGNSFDNQNQGFQSGYAEANGNVYTDTMTFSNVQITGQYFGAVTQGGYSSSDYAGAIGLAFESISEIGQPTVFQTLTTQGQVPTRGPVFGFYFPTPGSGGGAELDLGNLDGNRFQASTFNYVSLLEDSYWPITATNFGVNGNLGGSYYVVFETDFTPGATGFIYAYGPLAEQVYAKVSAANPCTDAICGADYSGDGEDTALFYYYPCSTTVDFTVQFGTNTFAIPFNMGPVSSGSEYCFAPLVSQDLGLNAWIFGPGAMANFYTVFDMANSRLGFAQLV